MNTPQKRDNSELVELVCQLHFRSLIHPDSKEMHNSYIEARKELESRLEQYANQTSHPAQGTSGITVADFEHAIKNQVIAIGITVAGVEQAAQACYALAQKMQGSQVDWDAMEKEFLQWAEEKKALIESDIFDYGKKKDFKNIFHWFKSQLPK